MFFFKPKNVFNIVVDYLLQRIRLVAHRFHLPNERRQFSMKSFLCKT